MKNLKKVLAILLTAVLLLSVVPMSVFAASEIIGVTIAPMEVMEPDDGSWCGHYEDPSDDSSYVENSWFHYDNSPKGITLEFADRTEEYEDYWSLYEAGYEVSYSDTQSYESPWEPGTYTCTLFINGKEYPYTVTVVENPIESVTVETVEVIKNWNGYMSGYWEDEDTYIENAYFHYEICPENLTVEFKDGSDFVGTYEEFQEMGYEVWYASDQYYDNQWDVGAHTAIIYVCGKEFDYTVEVVESPIESITVGTVELIQNVDGYMEGYWLDDETYVEDAYFYYTPNLENITVEFKDGSDFTGSIYELGEMGYGYDFSSDQSYENQWGLGTHTGILKISGKEVEITINIVESPVKKVTVEPIVLYECIGGWWDGYYEDPENQEGWISHQWYNYDAEPEYVTIEMNDGEIIEGDYYDVKEYIDISYDSEQSYETKWGKGTHTAYLEVLGKKFPYTVTIKASPIKSVSVEDITIVEKFEGSIGHHYIGNEEFRWFYYETEPDDITVTFTDNTTITGDAWDIETEFEEKYDCYMELSQEDDQTYDNQWGVGAHKSNLWVGDKKATYNVIIEESPIESIVVEDLMVIENTNGSYDEDVETYIYDDGEPKVIAKLKDGTYEYSQGGWMYFDWGSTKVDVYCDENSQYDEPWLVGDTNTVEVWVGGFSQTINYTIIENPVESIEVSDLSFPEYTNGYYTEMDGGEEFFYYEYKYRNIPFTVTLKDTTVLTASNHDGMYGVLINGKVYDIEIEDDGQYEEQWTVGSHEGKASLLGVSDTFNVEITESPVESLIVDDITVMGDIDSWLEEGEHYYFYYPEFTLVLKNGDELHSKYGEIVYQGNTYSLERIDDQYDSAWEAGKAYTVIGRAAGIETEFEVTVKKSPIKDVKLVGLPLKTIYKTNEIFNLKGATLRVYYTDGTYEDVFIDYDYTSHDRSQSIYLEKLDCRKDIWIDSYGFYEAGIEYVYMEVLNREIECPVKVVAETITDITIRNGDNRELYVKLNDTEYKAVEYKCDWGDTEEAGGWLVLENGDEQVSYYTLFYFSEDGFYLEILDRATDELITSNKLDSCAWANISVIANTQLKLAFINTKLHGIEFDGTVTAQNIDYIAEVILLLISEYVQEDDVISIEDEFVVVGADLITNNAYGFLGIEELDLTLSENYDSEDNTYKFYMPEFMGWELVFDGSSEINFIDDEAIIKLNSTDGTSLTIYVDENGCLAKWTICAHTYADAKDATCDECGFERLLPVSKTGAELVKEVDGTWWYYKDGLRCYETTLVKWSGKWFYVVDGIWDSSVTNTLVKYNGKWFWIVNGKWDTSVTDLVKYNGKWFYIIKGKWVTTTNDLIKHSSGKWFLIQNGKWNSTVETLFKKNGSWFYIKSGKWANNAETIFKYNGKRFYIKKGKVQLSFSGKVTVEGKRYTIKNGKVV